MSRFYGTAVNGRGNTVSFGGHQSAGEVHLRGWDAGVRVVPVGIKGERDRFEVYMTTGSNGRGRNVLLGTVHDTADGPVFEHAGDEMTDDAMTNADGDRYDETPVQGIFPDIPDTPYRHPSHP